MVEELNRKTDLN